MKRKTVEISDETFEIFREMSFRGKMSSKKAIELWIESIRDKYKKK